MHRIQSIFVEPMDSWTFLPGNQFLNGGLKTLPIATWEEAQCEN